MVEQVLISWCTGIRKRNYFEEEKIRLENFANMLNHNCDIQLVQCPTLFSLLISYADVHGECGIGSC